MVGRPKSSVDDVHMTNSLEDESKEVLVQEHDTEGFVRTTSSNDNRTGLVVKSKMVNPRILLLDFVDGTQQPFKIVKDILDNKTQIRGYAMMRLPRGGVSILFRRPGQKLFCEGLLKEELGNRHLSTSGNKPVLVERLQQAVTEEIKKVCIYYLLFFVFCFLF